MLFIGLSFYINIKGKAFNMKDIVNLTKKMYPYFYIFEEETGKFFYKRVDNFDKQASL